ncbi:MAG: hypothetical protein R3267_06555 [Paenisporosarcina sp.]|nr:hypothetical protein [Paenisporosarcina sp.]
MNFSFSKFNDIVESQKADIVHDNSEIIYLYSVMYGRNEVDQIDFSKFSIESLYDARDGIEEAITHEDDDGYVWLDPGHSMYGIINLQVKITSFVNAPKQLVASTFRFL